MRNWIRVVRLAIVVLAFAAPWVPCPVHGQSRLSGATAVDLTDVDQVLRLGVELEQQRRWGEALSHYEDALRRFPDQQGLAERVTLARFHYEVARRYADPSFLTTLHQFPASQASDLYGEVLLKIQAHHVESANWQALFDRGTSAVEIALSEPSFVQRHGVRIPPEQAVSALRGIREYAQQWPILSRQDSCDGAYRVALLVERQFGVSPTAVILEYACSAVASLDDYSAFLTGNQLDEILSQIEGNFVGLGVELKSETQALLIVNVIPGGPAAQAGLKPGDRIVQVSGRSTSEVSTDAAADLLKGPEGSTVDLVVMSAQGAARSMRIQRQVVEVPSVERVGLIDPRAGVGYFRLTSFQKTTSRDVEAALWKLHREGMRSLVIDVRGNPGGLLTSSVEIADKFIADGTIVATRGRANGEDFDYKAHQVGTWRVPLVVLIDGNSASASEIFAAAIRDSQRGTIVGERSFGKGSVQGIFPLSSGDAGLRITTAKFYSPSHQPISGRGVEPHVWVRTVARPVGDGQLAVGSDQLDPFMSAALQVAHRQLGQR